MSASCLPQNNYFINMWPTAKTQQYNIGNNLGIVRLSYVLNFISNLPTRHAVYPRYIGIASINKHTFGAVL